MECENYVKNGHNNTERFVGSCRVGLQFRALSSRALRLDVAAGLSGTTPVSARHIPVVPLPAPHNSQRVPYPDHPFMSTMDEISYWVYTKRAPCLMNYDNEIKKHSEEAQSSKNKPKSVPSVAEVPSPKKRKKRKLSLLDDNSSSTEKQQHVYFESSQNKKLTVMSSCKSDSLESDIDFNIKMSSVQMKKNKLQKNSRTTLHKKNKMITSTPKVAQLRRSLRQAQQSNNSQLNSSFEIFNTSILNGHNKKCEVEQTSGKKPNKLLAGGDHTTNNNKRIAVTPINKSKHEMLNGQFEDLSDVSGFTANYIRSTKMQSTKAPRKLRCKNNRKITKNAHLNTPKESTMIVCVNKSVSTAHKSAVQNCSTDSENVINLVTSRSNEKATKISKSTSLLKFMESKTSNAQTSKTKTGAIRTRKPALNISFQSRSSTSRYPKRYKNHSKTQEEPQEIDKINITDKVKKNTKITSEFNNSDRKENTETVVTPKTRSGRNTGLTLHQPENSVLVLSNSTEQVSSMVSMNVASPVVEQKERKKKRITRHLRSMKVQQGTLPRDLVREKSGFSACFSDSDEDTVPLRQPKFFCA